MSDEPKQDQATIALERGLGFLSKSDWFELQTFALISMHANPRTVQQMASALKIPPPAKDPDKWDPTTDPNWDADFTKTTNDYDQLGKYCDGFWNKTRPGMVGLANDIVQYQTRMDSYFKRLIGVVDDYDVAGDNTAPVKAKLEALWNDWQLPTPPSDAAAVKAKFVTALTRLKEDAETRSKTAADLEIDINKFHDDLIISEATFDKSAGNYEEKYGTKSKEMKELEIRFESLNSELEGYRKKERDEVIVLGSSPVYLVLWPIGPLIMAAIQIGVGVDLGLTRAKIDKLVGDVDEVKKKMTAKSIFKASYDSIKTYTKKTSTQIKAILPAVAALKDGWGTIAADLKAVLLFLEESGKGLSKEDWFSFGSDLDSAREKWKFLAGRADHFRLNATVREVPNVEEFLKGLKA